MPAFRQRGRAVDCVVKCRELCHGVSRREIPALGLVNKIAGTIQICVAIARSLGHSGLFRVTYGLSIYVAIALDIYVT
jgi:fructose-specific phosphotransferase system IIC component